MNDSPISPPPLPKTSGGEKSLLKTVIIILLTLLFLGATLLAFYFYSEYRESKTDLDAKIDAAVVDASKELEDKLEAEFAEREKTPYATFTGPADYSSLSFKYPKTWSVYIAKDASSGGEFEAYLHPGEVSPVSATTVNALRVTIKDETTETAEKRYASALKKGNLKASIADINGESATRYDGALNKNFVGSVVILKLRDKTATIQTDAEIYRDDFNQIINSITFNK